MGAAMFEYHVHTVDRRDTMQDVLNQHARDGWKLHTCTESTYGHMLVIFERPRNDSRGWKGDYHGPG
jgi:hypothetical protein